MTRQPSRLRKAPELANRDPEERFGVWVVERIRGGREAAESEYLACREQLAMNDQSWRAAMLVAEGFNRTSMAAQARIFAVVVPAQEIGSFQRLARRPR